MIGTREQHSLPSSPRKEPVGFFKVPGDGKYENRQIFDCAATRTLVTSSAGSSKESTAKDGGTSPKVAKPSYYPYLRKVRLSVVTVPLESLVTSEDTSKETREEDSLERLNNPVTDNGPGTSCTEDQDQVASRGRFVSGEDISIVFVNFGAAVFAFRIPQSGEGPEKVPTFLEKRPEARNKSTEKNQQADNDTAIHNSNVKGFSGKADNNLIKFFRFKDTVTCLHAICDEKNVVQLAVGLSKGEIVVYFDVFSTQTVSVVHNKESVYNNSQVTAVAWAPGNSSRLVSSHSDGTLIIWDSREGIEEKNTSNNGSHNSSQEKASTFSSETSSSGLVGSVSPSLHRPSTPRQDKNSKTSANNSSVPANSLPRSNHILTVTRPAKHKRFHPISIWRFGGGTITDLAFSPDGTQIALTSKDGYLRVCDFVREQILFSFQSYFGALLCVCWSPDGQYVATGGEDDLVSLWEPITHQLVCRMQSHTSFVSAVGFDSLLCRDGHYRLGSVGQDTKIVLWDYPGLEPVHVKTQRSSREHFSESSNGMSSLQEDFRTLPGKLIDKENSEGSRSFSRHSLKAPLPLRIQQGQMGLSRSNSPLYSNAGRSPRARTGSSFAKNPVTSNVSEPIVVVHAKPRSKVSLVDPLLVHTAHSEPLTDIVFTAKGILTASSSGLVKYWSRPPQQTLTPLSLESTVSQPFFRVSMEIPGSVVGQE
eukprot:jgi/Galph1/860/GphlegSOOS_G5669.1